MTCGSGCCRICTGLQAAEVQSMRRRGVRIMLLSAVRIFAPHALDAAGLHDHAKALRALPNDVTDKAAAAAAAWAKGCSGGARGGEGGVGGGSVGVGGGGVGGGGERRRRGRRKRRRRRKGGGEDQQDGGGGGGKRQRGWQRGLRRRRRRGRLRWRQKLRRMCGMTILRRWTHP